MFHEFIYELGCVKVPDEGLRVDSEGLGAPRHLSYPAALSALNPCVGQSLQPQPPAEVSSVKMILCAFLVCIEILYIPLHAKLEMIPLCGYVM